MFKAVGLVLVIFGVVGIVIALLVYRWLTRANGALQKLRGFLTANAGGLQKGMELGQTALRLTDNTLSYLTGMNVEVGKIAERLEPVVAAGGDTVAYYLGEAGNALHRIQNELDLGAIEVPVLEAGATPLGTINVETPFQVVTGVQFDPPGVTSDRVRLNTDVSLPFKLRTAAPFVPVSAALGSTGDMLLGARQQLQTIHSELTTVTSQTGQFLKVLRTFVDEARELLFKISVDILPGIQAAGQYSVLSMTVLLLLGYFALLHLVLALLGLALLFV